MEAKPLKLIDIGMLLTLTGIDQWWWPPEALTRHTHQLLPLLPSGPDGVHNLTLRGDQRKPP